MQFFLLTGMSDLSGWKPEWCEQVFAKIAENPQHQFLFLSKRPDLLEKAALTDKEKRIYRCIYCEVKAEDHKLH